MNILHGVYGDRLDSMGVGGTKELFWNMMLFPTLIGVIFCTASWVM